MTTWDKGLENKDEVLLLWQQLKAQVVRER
jgi:hypothetical protein